MLVMKPWFVQANGKRATGRPRSKPRDGKKADRLLQVEENDRAFRVRSLSVSSSRWSPRAIVA
jgi:hypothetical protein